MPALLAIATRNVFRNRRRTFITAAALVVGIFAVVSIRGVLNGLQGAIIASTVKGMTGGFQVHRAGYLANVLSPPLTLDFALDDPSLAGLAKLPGVTAVAPRIMFGGSLSVPKEKEEDTPEPLFFMATAVDPTLEPQVCPDRAGLMSAGSRFDEAHLLVGEAMLGTLDAKLGDEAVLLAPDRDGALNGELSHVGGALKSVMPGELKVAQVPLAAAQRLLRMEGRATELAVAVKDLAQVPSLVAQARALLGPTYEVHAWDDVATDRRTFMQRQNAISALVSVVFLLLMLLGVANTMLMSVLERTREVGTMMAVGVTRAQVLLLFLLEALSLGVVGVAGGLALGTTFVAALGAKGLTVTPPSATVALTLYPSSSPAFLVVVAALALLGCAVFSLYPALRASRLRPVEALAGR